MCAVAIALDHLLLGLFCCDLLLGTLALMTLRETYRKGIVEALCGKEQCKLNVGIGGSRILWGMG